MKYFYKKGVFIQSRSGVIGQEELVNKDDLEDLMYDEMTPEIDAEHDRLNEIMTTKGRVDPEDWEYIWGKRKL